MKIPCSRFISRLAAGCAGPLLAAVALAAGGAEHREIINAGIGGDNTADLLARLDRDVLAHAPELVVLLAGTNDLLNSRNEVPLAQYRENLGALVRRIQAKGIRLVLMTMPPVYPPYLLQRHPAEFYGRGGPAPRLAAGNAVVHEVARENHLPVVELFDAFQQAGGASERPASLIRNAANSGKEDGIHPTAAGYRLIGGLVAEVMVRENLSSRRRIVCFGDSITRGVHMAGEGTATGETYPAFLSRALDEKHSPGPAAR
ncbi:MAG: GDSL-type esterase/lipase family protein [Phycisphaerae bacterium]|jgi:lysophospholipase L1-like esterase